MKKMVWIEISITRKKIYSCVAEFAKKKTNNLDH